MTDFESTGVKPEELQQLLDDYAREGYSCVVRPEPGGTFTVTARSKQAPGAAGLAAGANGAADDDDAADDPVDGVSPLGAGDGGGPIVGPGPSAAGSGDFVSNAVRIAETEWEFFGRQEFRLDGTTSHGGHKEAEPGYRDRIGTYWTEGVNRPGLDGASAVPWSAAFISWVMKKAGAGNRFSYSSQHSRFIDQGIRDGLSGRIEAGFWGRQLNEYKPSVGDLVCWTRQPGIDFDHQNHGDYKGHSDLVVEVDADRIWVIGGNVGNSVTRRPLALTPAGYLPPTTINGETLFAILADRIGMPVSARDVAPTPAPAEVPAPQPEAPAPTPNARAAPLPLDDQPVTIAWGRKVSPAFEDKVLKMATLLGCDPSHLMAAMAFETGESFSAKKLNPQSGAVGLIQFTQPAADDLHITLADLAKMTEIDQLDYVMLYMLPYRNRISNPSDLYMAIFCPAAVGKPDATILYQRPSRAYDQNRGLDANGDGQITKAEAASRVQAALVRGLSEGFRG